MARARNIKPAFFKNEQLVELPMATRLLFIGLWTLADREGRLEDRPKRIKMEIFPGDSVDVDKALAELDAEGFIHRYEKDGELYIQILAFLKHQNPHHREPASVIPAPEKPRLSPNATVVKPEAAPPMNGHEAPALPEASPSTAVLIPDSPFLIPESREKRRGKGSRLPPAWLPSESLLAWAKNARGDLDLESTTAKFKDHWAGVPGSRGVKLDWDATFRNWVRNEAAPRKSGAEPDYSEVQRRLEEKERLANS